VTGRSQKLLTAEIARKDAEEAEKELLWVLGELCGLEFLPKSSRFKNNSSKLKTRSKGRTRVFALHNFIPTCFAKLSPHCTTSWKVVDSVGAPGELALTVMA
jgi:hypothetical protein